MSNNLRCFGMLVTVFMMAQEATCGDKVPRSNKAADRLFELRASKIVATEGDPIMLKLTLIYKGNKRLRFDHPVSGVVQPGNGRPPWVLIEAPKGWKVRREAFQDAFPELDNSLCSGTVILDHEDKLVANIPLHWRFRDIPIGKSLIKVTWPIWRDMLDDNRSPYAFTNPSVKVDVVINPRIVRK